MFNSRVFHFGPLLHKQSKHFLENFFFAILFPPPVYFPRLLPFLHSDRKWDFFRQRHRCRNSGDTKSCLTVNKQKSFGVEWGGGGGFFWASGTLNDSNCFCCWFNFELLYSRFCRTLWLWSVSVSWLPVGWSICRVRWPVCVIQSIDF